MAIRWLIPWMLERECPDQEMLSSFAHLAKGFHRGKIPWSSLWTQNDSTLQHYDNLTEAGKNPGNLLVSVRHLHDFRDLDIPKKLGIDKLVERAWSYLRFGTAPQYSHSDGYDNILMQLTEEIEIIMHPANCTSLPVLADANFNMKGVLPFVTEGMPHGESRAPFFHVHLKPGEGVIIPSDTMHKIISRDPKRIALNAFFEPRFGKMQWTSAPSNFYLRNHDSVLATRALWMKALTHLWETRKVSMFYHTARMEVL